METLTYRCPQCWRVTEWTDGQSIEAGDEVDEMWCQVCGHEFDPHTNKASDGG